MIEFEGKAEFSDCKFLKNVRFTNAKLKRETNFKFTEFESVSFAETDFGECIKEDRIRASFLDARFLNDAEFSSSKFISGADFGFAQFRRSASFRDVTFEGETIFIYTLFSDRTIFECHINGPFFLRYVSFGNKDAVTFDVEDLSTTSFMDTDITRIRFSDKARWSRNDRFRVRDEERFQQSKGRYSSVESILSLYRNLRENYEYRLKFDEAGQFFIKEMELKRKYRDISSVSDLEFKIILVRKLREKKGSIPNVIENDRVRRNFSLTGLYYHFSRYGESIARPIGIGAIILILSTIFWGLWSNPFLEPHIPILDSSTNTVVDSNSTSHFVGFQKIWEPGHLSKSFERSFADFLPLISIGGDIKVGAIDYIIKLLSGTLTFVLLAIALRRKFERKYTR
jgi:hypothetical protein